MSYRPITDFWILTRAKFKDGRKFYGAYLLGGFPERARALIGAPIDAPVLHVCGGMARYYLYRGGFGSRDKTLDLDPDTSPDYLGDARDPASYNHQEWTGILIDPPYSEEDARQYPPGPEVYPSPNLLVINALAALKPGRKVGIIHHVVPRCPKNAKFTACVAVMCGFNNRIRAFTVFERLS